MDDNEKTAMPKSQGFRKSRSRRFLSIGSLASKVSSSYVGQKLKGVFVSEEKAQQSLSLAHERNAQRMAHTFGELKGAVMKVGQMLSLYSGILPDPYTKILSSLQKQAPPVKFHIIQHQLENELNLPVSEVFESIEPEPFACASIGQVHLGTLKDGRQVACKIQYPGVEKTVDSDVKNLRLVLKASGLMKKQRGIDDILDEIRLRLLEELDYRNELQNLTRFRKLYADDNRIVIPKGHRDRTTKRVLCMDYIEGLGFNKVCSQKSLAYRNWAGQTLIDIYLRQLFDFAALHADPNPGNFAFLDNQIVLYDFGCVRYFPKDFVQAYATLIQDSLDGHFDRMPADLESIGVYYLREEPLDIDLLEKFAIPLLEPFLNHGVYNFGTSQIHKIVIKLGIENWKSARHFRAPPEIVFLDRVIVGMYNNLRKLGAQGDFRSTLLTHLKNHQNQSISRKRSEECTHPE
jgi:predicted unusual protein kinase regulating ubiquinone biosynthesis (AarF/ABC1/UbiB family)